MTKKSFRVELSDELYAKVKIKAAITGIPVAVYCREALRIWVEEQKPIILLPEDQPNLSAEALADIHSDITVTETPEDQPTGKIVGK